ncbi:cupredoxin domain-containing protein [Halobiforma nitratireducens]|uniref:Halocyanin n=1 Tax=Halobiforma nitratireducens JCM 10879 TaxID=1227454 RepID=M0LQR4_9EURY|nr:plastocyanin/azurin family copper-binding protein [Halobiforma nitratireducens]EMA35433.1 halocyanin [Halobiforma nitratireducens JCM 10879]
MNPRPASRRRLLVAFGAASSAALAGCLGDDESENEGGDEAESEDATADDAEEEEDVIEIETREGEEKGEGEEPDFVFDPAIVELEPGTTVRWVNTDGVFHTVTSTDSLEEKTPSDEFDATIASDGDTFEWTPDSDGVQHYYCEPHAGFMEGSLIVGDGNEDEREAAEEAHGHDEEDDEVEDEEANGDGTADIDEEFADLTGEDHVEIETREGQGDEPDFVFDPAFATVDEGTTVEWVNTDGVFHTVTSTADLEQRSGGGETFDTTISSEGDTFEWEADEPGRQPYYCSPHAGFMYGALEIE